MEQDKIKRIDVRGESCPMNFVKTKVTLAEMMPGERLEVLLDEGEALRNVPRSLTEEGHQIIKVINQGNSFTLIIQKGQ